MYNRTNAMHMYRASCGCNAGAATNPVTAANTVPAGEACSGLCAGFDIPSVEGMSLAKIYFPSQIYRAGFCPDEALRCGTLFPEFVGLYQ